MNRVFAYLVRFFMIILGYAAASLAASAFLNVVFLGSAGFAQEEMPMIATSSLMFSTPFVALFVAYFAFIPSVPAILLAEILGKRDWLFYALAGGFVGLVVMGFFWHAAGQIYAISDALDPSAPQSAGSQLADPVVVLAVVGAGMCGGIAYWLVTGRTAGLWRRDRDGATSPAP